MDHRARRGRFCGFAAALLVALACSGQARADDVYFKNGDHLTGTIQTAGDGKMTISTATVGSVVINMSDVKTFSTDEPVKLLMQDGTLIDQKVTQGPEGSVMTAPGGTIAPQAVALDHVVKINAPPAQWHGTIVINGSLTQSNTDTVTFGASINADRRTDLDRVLFDAQYLYGRQKVNGTDTTNEDNWHIDATYDYFATKQLYGYGNIRVEKDRIQFLDLRLTPGAGLGYQWVEQPTLNFRTEAGMAWVYQEYSTQPSPSEEVSARVAYHVDATLFDSKVKVFNDVQYFPSVENTRDYIVLTDAGIHVALTKTMFSELKAEVDYNSQPAPGAHRTNTEYILGVGWTF
jgi:putative salt-induced outer membrane protein YdiY